MSEDLDTANPAPGSAIALAELRQVALAMSVDELEDRYGRAFLILWHGDLAVPDGPGATLVEIESCAEADYASAAGDARLVHPIRRTGRSVGHLVSAGRTSNNDVVIPDSSVSRFHAFFKEGGDGRFCVQDAGSTNGTAVNGEKVPPQGEGAPVALKSGDVLLIGQVCLRFLEVGQLHELLVGGP